VERVKVELEGVPETLLWTLYYRASEARRADRVLDDPMAVELLERIDYPFEERFGSAAEVVAQGQALRALRFDQAIRRFAAAHPGGTVVALGEGLETQFWRVDDGRLRWLAVELPETVEVSRRLLPAAPRRRVLACSALDPAWMDEVDASRGVLVTAQGLLMYLEPADVERLIETVARRFPGSGILFDTVPRWWSRKATSGKMVTAGGFRAPPMPWGLDAGEQQALARRHPELAEVRDLRIPRGRGPFWGALAPLLLRLPVVRSHRPAIVLASATLAAVQERCRSG
jgi:O-methyltransferase involved in polyketide biosynthesis